MTGMFSRFERAIERENPNVTRKSAFTNSGSHIPNLGPHYLLDNL